MDDYLAYLDHALERELLHGCSELDFRNGLKLDARSTFESHRAAVALIRDLAERPDLAVWYAGSKADPLAYSPQLLDVYVDERHFEYWFDPRTNLLIRFLPQAGHDPSPRALGAGKERPNVAPLREKAVSLLKRLIADFDDRMCDMHPFEANDGRGAYHFRWDDYSDAATETDEAPFVQVSVFANGALRSFTNALRSPF